MSKESENLNNMAVCRLQNKTRQEGASRQGGLGACPSKKIWNLEAQECIFKEFFAARFLESQSWASVEVHFLLLSDTGAKLTTICILKHSNVVTRILT